MISHFGAKGCKRLKQNPEKIQDESQTPKKVLPTFREPPSLILSLKLSKLRVPSFSRFFFKLIVNWWFGALWFGFLGLGDAPESMLFFGVCCKIVLENP